MKKILLLGGSYCIVPVIRQCHSLGCKVITCDYLPDNIAHKYSDEYYNVSVIDKEKVLELAKKLGIDGIMSFACDAGVVTASYVAEQLGLPFQGSYWSNKILQDKGLFRNFLQDNGFNCPHARSYCNKEKALNDISYYKWPVIVKPVDSAGSKGVTRVNTPNYLSMAIDTAIASSHNGYFIIEDFITFEGYHSSSDVFSINGEVKFCTFSDQLFDSDACNPYAPALIIWPSSMKKKYQDYLTKEIQRLISLLEMKTGIYNIETCVGNNGKPYIMEVSARGGGCRIAEIQQRATGIDLIDLEIRKSIGIPVPENAIGKFDFDGIWCEMVVHNSDNITGTFKGVYIDPEIKEKYIKMIDIQVNPGDIVEPFTGGNKALGDIFLRFETREELDYVMSCSKKWFQLLVE